MNKELESLLNFCNNNKLEILSVNFIKHVDIKQSVVRYENGEVRFLECLDGDWE